MSVSQPLPWETPHNGTPGSTSAAAPAGASDAAPAATAPAYEQVPLDVYDAPAPAPARRTPAVDIDSLNPAQREAVLTTEGPLLVLAGAGSGKTRVLTYRIAHMVADLGVRPWQILAITFTNKAAAEMRERLGALLPDGTRGMWVCTFHAMCVRMLREDADLLGYTGQFTIYDDDDSRRMVRDIMQALGIEQKSYPLNMIRSKISAAKNAMVGPDEFQARASSPPRAEGRAGLPGARAPSARGQRHGLRRPARARARALAHPPRGARALPGALSATSRWTSTRTPTTCSTRSPTCSPPSTRTSWSWATTTSLSTAGAARTSPTSSTFEKDFPAAKVVKLEQNYRSTGHILNAANAVVRHNSQRKEKRLFHRGGRWREDPGLPGLGRARRGPLDRRRDREAARRRHELRRYRRLLPHQRAVAHPGRYVPARGRALQDRGRHALLRPRRDPRRHGLPQDGREPGRRDERQARHQHAAPRHRLHLHRQDRGARAREPLQLLPGVRDRHGRDGSFTAKVRSALGDFVALVREGRRMDGELQRVVEAIVERSGLMQALRAEGTVEAEGRVENIQEFLGVAAEFEETHDDIEGTLESLEELRAAGVSDVPAADDLAGTGAGDARHCGACGRGRSRCRGAGKRICRLCSARRRAGPARRAHRRQHHGGGARPRGARRPDRGRDRPHLRRARLSRTAGAPRVARPAQRPRLPCG